MLACLRMSIKLCICLHITTKWTRYFFFALIFHWFSFHISQILFDMNIGIWIGLSARLEWINLYFTIWRFLWFLWFFWWVLWHSAWSKFLHALASAFMKKKIWSKYVSFTRMAVGSRLIIIFLHLQKYYKKYKYYL